MADRVLCQACPPLRLTRHIRWSFNIGIIDLAAAFPSCLLRVSHPDCRATDTPSALVRRQRSPVLESRSEATPICECFLCTVPGRSSSRLVKHTDTLSRWTLDVQARRGTNVAVVALANKIARTIRVLLAREREDAPPSMTNVVAVRSQ
jgi:hypothetical protein